MTSKTVDSVKLGHPSGKYESSVCTFISAAITTATEIMCQNIRIRILAGTLLRSASSGKRKFLDIPRAPRMAFGHPTVNPFYPPPSVALEFMPEELNPVE